MNEGSGARFAPLLAIHLVLVLHNEERVIIKVTKELDVGPGCHEHQDKKIVRIVQAYSILGTRKSILL